MQIDDYQKKAARTINKRLTNGERELHALHGMAGEVGEIHSLYQKKYQGHSMTNEALKEELGDLLWFVAEMCTVKGWSMSEICADNISKLGKRYAEGFTENESVNRDEYVVTAQDIEAYCVSHPSMRPVLSRAVIVHKDGVTQLVYQRGDVFGARLAGERIRDICAYMTEHKKHTTAMEVILENGV